MATLGRVELQAADLEIGSRQLNVVGDAITYMAQRGLVLSNAPSTSYRGEPIEDLTGLDDNQLGDLLNDVSSWCGYVDGELAKADASREDAKADYEFISARIRLSVPKKDEDGKRLSNPDRDDHVTVHPKVVEAHSRVLYFEALYSMTKVLRDAAQRNWETVSRRITQRGQEIERMKREGNIGNLPLQGRSFRRPGQQ